MWPLGGGSFIPPWKEPNLVMMSTQPCTAEKLMTTTSMHTYTIPYCEDFRYKNMPMIFGCFCLSGMLIPRSAYHRNARALRLYAVCRLRILGTRTHAYIVDSSRCLSKYSTYHVHRWQSCLMGRPGSRHFTIYGKKVA